MEHVPTEPTNQEIVNNICCFAATKPYLNKWVGYVAALITKIIIRQTHRKQNCEKQEILNVMNSTNLCSILQKGYKDNIS